MSQNNSDKQSSPFSNPLILATVVVLVLLVLIFSLRSEQGEGTETANNADLSIPPIATGKIERTEFSAPGARAREEISALRQQQAINWAQVLTSAQNYQQQGELADAYLLYFFAAREGVVDAMLVMGQMSDPTSFDPANSLLNFPDPIQAHKWYLQASYQGSTDAAVRLSNLKQWALSEAGLGNAEASQLLLYYE